MKTSNSSRFCIIPFVGSKCSLREIGVGLKTRTHARTGKELEYATLAKKTKKHRATLIFRTMITVLEL